MKDIPNKLKTAIEKAKTSVFDNKFHELILPLRKNIWEQMGNESIGCRRRGFLSISCARYTQNIWQDTWNDNESLEDILIIAEDYRNNKASEQKVRDAVNSFWTVLDNLIYEGKNLSDINAGYSAAVAASTIIRDENYEDNGNLDEDNDPYDWDSSFYSSIAYSGGAPWEDSSSKEKRLEYWLWYLNTAVPDAWKSE